ncbi:MAG: tRNA 2-thiouridine(34) synthase MnmA [Thiobacillus sp.]|uniref:tRNA 2-thiouridine(34) synthase MnmA n=1 Tax=Thiobacillus sp. TaxID=924 RepID=UPI0028949049|nr:tRNA 2-thiouridine(34) synthase MnmA [Thiobacillus sp.]MDT3707634.1 tRNA 2-thiouridine(34) synthase MnmA [Thiobacillus sp.]
MKTRVVVGMSGGVDSAVAAYLLKQQGFDVLGVFMKNWDDDDNTDHCTARQDFLDVLAVADVLGIEVEAVNFAAEYKERVFSYFLAEYRAGRTPNPDVLCNAEIKFKAFLDDAIARGAEYIATGHYVGKGTDATGRATLLRATDANKDQSYFLYRLSQAQLTPALFPLATLPKPEVREIARKIGLPNAAKKDSTGICFIGERNFREFLERYLPRDPGDMQTPDGRVVGRHQGLMYYTLGQRQGLGIGGQKDANDEPWFVAAKDMATNTLVVVQGHDHPLLKRLTLVAGQLNWIAGTAPDPGKAYTAKTRYRQTDAACRITRLGTDTLELAFDTPQWAITPGQSVVLYDGEICLGGGIIC